MTDFVVAKKGNLIGYLSTDKENTIFGYKFGDNIKECVNKLSKQYPNFSYTTINGGKGSRQFESYDNAIMIKLIKRLNIVKSNHIANISKTIGGR